MLQARRVGDMQPATPDPCGGTRYLVFLEVGVVTSLIDRSTRECFLLLSYRKLRTLRVANNPLLSDKAFPSSIRRDPSPTPSGSSSRDKPFHIDLLPG
jgi:hypothetical protein